MVTFEICGKLLWTWSVTCCENALLRLTDFIFELPRSASRSFLNFSTPFVSVGRTSQKITMLSRFFILEMPGNFFISEPAALMMSNLISNSWAFSKHTGFGFFGSKQILVTIKKFGNVEPVGNSPSMDTFSKYLQGLKSSFFIPEILKWRNSSIFNAFQLFKIGLSFNYTTMKGSYTDQPRN